MQSKNTKIIRVEASQLRIHPAAQRELNTLKLKKITNEFDFGAIGTLDIVHYTIGDITAYWVVDGQHRLKALLANGLGRAKLDCVLHEDARDDARAHDLFLKLNDRTVVPAWAKYVNEFGKGDRTAVMATAIAESFGLSVEKQVGDGNIACVNTMKKVYNMDEGETLGDSLLILVAAWGTTANAVEGKILEGMALVTSRHNGDLDRAALAKALAKYPGGAAGILGDARGLAKLRHKPMSSAVAEAIIDTYNKGRRKNKLAV